MKFTKTLDAISFSWSTLVSKLLLFAAGPPRGADAHNPISISDKPEVRQFKPTVKGELGV